jgi:hypothetical protein
MTVRTKVVLEVKNFKFPAITGEAELLIVELGGSVTDVQMPETTDYEFQAFIRSWPSMESALAWCEYVMGRGSYSAEILED